MATKFFKIDVLVDFRVFKTYHFSHWFFKVIIIWKALEVIIIIVLNNYTTFQIRKGKLSDCYLNCFSTWLPHFECLKFTNDSTHEEQWRGASSKESYMSQSTNTRKMRDLE